MSEMVRRDHSQWNQGWNILVEILRVLFFMLKRFGYGVMVMFDVGREWYVSWELDLQWSYQSLVDYQGLERL